jgi:hypothetical protein
MVRVQHRYACTHFFVFFFNFVVRDEEIICMFSIKSRILLIFILQGAGINVANKKPTVCINGLLPKGSSRLLSTGEVLAETLNKFEGYSFFRFNNSEVLDSEKEHHHFLIEFRILAPVRGRGRCQLLPRILSILAAHR